MAKTPKGKLPKGETPFGKFEQLAKKVVTTSKIVPNENKQKA